MSSFSDNFKRDSEEDMLEYDDSAFYYFSISLLTFVLVPLTWSLFRSIVWGDITIESFKSACQCSRCLAMIKIKKNQARKQAFTGSFYFKLMVAAFLWYIWFLNAQVVNSLENLQSFDPFQILDIPNEASPRDIKKQYRKLSLSMHPDKNPDNPLAVQEFIRLTKAYNILTDETAFENFKKYGNPDGPGSYNVAIALPRFLLAPDNQISVLCCAFFILLVVIPGSLYINFGDSTMKDENGVMMQNKREYGARLNENLLPKNIPLILSQSIEFQSIEMTDDAELAIFKKMKSNEDIDELVPKTTSRRNQDMNIKPLLLVLGHIFRDENVKSPYFKDGLSEILKQGVNHLNMMIDTSMELNALARTGASAKKMGYSAISSIINFQQFFVQGLWTSNDPMMQLPGFDVNEIKAYRRQLREHQIPDGKIDTFCRLTPEQRSKLGLFGGDKAKLEQLEKVIKVMPLVSVHQKVTVEGEKTITAADIISFEISVKYDGLPDDQGPGYIHSQAYPFVKKSNWYFVITDAKTKENVIQVERLQARDSNVCMFEMKQRFGQAGKFSFYCYILNDSFIGFDKEVAIEVDVAKEDPDRVIEPYSQEDINAVKGPGMVQSMLAMDEEEDDDESSDDNAEVLIKKLEQAGVKTPDAAKLKEAKAKAGKKVGESELIE